MNSRRWYYFLPLAGMAFGVWYVKSAFADVIYSDYYIHCRNDDNG